MNNGAHDTYRECGREYPSGNACENQVSLWAEDEETGLTGYWCSCGAYRGRDGEAKGRIVATERSLTSKPSS